MGKSFVFHFILSVLVNALREACELSGILGYVQCNNTLLGLLAKIKVLGVMPGHLPLVLDVGTVLVSAPPLSCVGFVCCHCTGRWAVLDITHGKDSGAFR